MKQSAVIKGLGFHVPERILSNKDLEQLVETSDEWITSRSGIKTRHVVSEGESLTDLSHGAALKALDDAGLSPEAITHILVATFSPESYIPSAACALQDRLGLRGRVAYDISAACTGFLYALENARAILALHPESKILVCSGDVVTSRVNWEDRATCVLFGDGCGAAVVAAEDGGPHRAVIRDVSLASDGALGDLLTIRGGGSGRHYRLGEPIGEDFFVQMQGREVFKHAVRSMTEVCNGLLERHGLTTDDVDMLLPHQANLRIIEAVGKKLGIPGERVFINVDKYGNTSAASVPIALSEAVHGGSVQPGQRVLLTAFGGGFTWGACLLDF
ncbi:beta-ketoacyl-ACP synthase III [Paucidesulfovibrio longus]|uniref:beta-ketoacyl-ACP synthase III n=1 Tax=Paucidesulfovibrio longus TaxID=889 RepID=UPI0003B34DEB|nr:beta-ketoacyl-ACP synthase III [Paucidesulfovibrio longus]